MSQRLLTDIEANEYKISLSGYHPNGQTVVDFARSNFGVIAGPTGAGKDTLRNLIISRNPDVFKPVLSTTSRPLRTGEQDGVEYHFKDLDFFDKGLDEQRFLQVEVVHDQQLAGLDFMDIQSLGKDNFGLGILIVNTEKKLRLLNRDLKTVFIVPPSLDELIRRINTSRSMDKMEVNRRLNSSKTEIEQALKDSNYYLLANDNLDQTANLAIDFFVNNKKDETAEQTARICMNNILNTLSNYVQA